MQSQWRENAQTQANVTLSMKKRSEATQKLRAGCGKADPQTNRQGRLQYTAQLISAQCNYDSSILHRVSLKTTRYLIATLPITSGSVDRISYFFTLGLTTDCVMNSLLKIP